jgi:hypothetical protein
MIQIHPAEVHWSKLTGRMYPLNPYKEIRNTETDPEKAAQEFLGMELAGQGPALGTLLSIQAKALNDEHGLLAESSVCPHRRLHKLE